jgi:hypothetical protein
VNCPQRQLMAQGGRTSWPQSRHRTSGCSARNTCSLFHPVPLRAPAEPEIVDIIEPPRRRDDPGIVVPVTIYLEPRRSTSRSAAGTIDASAGGVPDAAREMYKRAVESAQSGDRKKAIDQLKQALTIYPSLRRHLTSLAFSTSLSSSLTEQPKLYSGRSRSLRKPFTQG